MNAGTDRRPRVFVDTNIFCYAAQTKVVQRADSGPATLTSRDGSQREITLVKHTNTPRAPRTADDALRAEIEHLPTIARHAFDGSFELVHSHEVNMELLFQPLVDVPPGRLHGAPLTLVQPATDYRGGLERFPEDTSTGARINKPSESVRCYERALAASPESSQDILRELLLRLPDRGFGLWLDFRRLVVEVAERDPGALSAGTLLLPKLRSLEDDRYDAIRSALDVESLGEAKRPNGWVDAFLLWTAELADCEFFLTVEKGIRSRYSHELVTAVSPSEFLSSLGLD